jgi:hypothetical protein
MSISYEQFAQDPASAVARLAEIDPMNSAHRRDVMRAMQALAERLIVPVAPMLAHSQDGGSHQYFDLQQVAGSDFSGLLLGTLEERFPALEEQPPSDQTLAPILDELGFEIDDPSHRADFFRAWMGLRATHLLRPLLKLLEAGELSPQERKDLERLEQLPLPGLELQQIRLLLSRPRTD